MSVAADLLLSEGDVHVLYGQEGVLAGLLEQAHQVDVELGAQTQQDQGQAEVGSNWGEAVLDTGQ